MPKPNAKLRIIFDFDVKLPEAALDDDSDVFQRKVETLLGGMVFQGMPTVTGKQLEKAGGRLYAHTYSLEAVNLLVPQVSREVLVAAAPHLMPDEIKLLERKVAGKLLGDNPDEQFRAIRRYALGIVDEYRTVPCTVTAVLTSGVFVRLAGKLNLTNGSVLLDEQNRQVRLQANQEGMQIIAVEGEVSLPATCAGHTLSGPVIETAIKDIALFRDVLLAAWRKQA